MKLRLLLIAAFLCQPALADIYKYVDESGNVTFTNTPIKGAVRIMSEPAPARRDSSSGSTGAAPRRAKVNTPSPADFPKVDAATQKSRDTNRKLILQNELAAEQQQLDTAQRALQDADKNKSPEETSNPKLYLDRLGRLREAVTMHQKNIEALQAELARAK